MITARSVTFSYRSTVALDSLSFESTGRIVGLVGPNGAGKTTLLRLLATEVDLQAGALTCGTHDLTSRRDRSDFRCRLGYMPQSIEMYGDYTCREMVEYVGWLRRVRPDDLRRSVAEALDSVNLAGEADRKIRTLSGGMRQRVGLAQALVNRPDYLVLDEPTVGLDPVERRRFLQRLAVVGSASTVVLSTHLVEDVAQLCDAVIVIARARILFCGDVQSFAGLAAGVPVTGESIGRAYEDLAV